MNLSTEQLQLFAALGALALLLCTLIVLVGAIIWYFDDCSRIQRLERRRSVQVRDRRIADRKHMIMSRGEL